MNNNQTWTLAKQFPNVAEQGLQALRDWSAKADMQRERMAILQYYAEERENRDAREARNANLARNVVGGMGVSLGSANSFNSFGGGLYFDNNLNTMMVRLSFLDREMRLDEITSEFIDKRLYNDKGELNYSLDVRDYRTMFIANAVNNEPDPKRDNGLAAVMATGANEGIKFSVDEVGKMTAEGAVNEESWKRATEAFRVSKDDLGNLSPKNKGKVVDKANNAITNVSNAITEKDPLERYADKLRGDDKSLSKEEAIKIARQEFEEKYKSRYSLVDEPLKTKYAMEDLGRQLDEGGKQSSRQSTNIQNENDKVGDTKTTSISDSHLRVFVDSVKEGNLKSIGYNLNDGGVLDRLANHKSFTEMAEYLSSKGYSTDDIKLITAVVVKYRQRDAKVMAENENVPLQDLNKFLSDQELLKAGVDNIEGGTALDNICKVNRKQQFMWDKNLNASKAAPIQELAPENKGKPDSQASLVSAIATPKPTLTYKQEKTEQEKDEERRKREEKDVLDRVEPNRTADHSPRALNEKNTTASIEEQKIILAQQERNMTQEEKMRMEQEIGNDSRNKQGMDV
ncbi:hypothetical protein HT662_09165 [Ursidibacter maritimus]|uniref:Uncharacterized protein n=1 Tax=Ursidibacter maritimus TaxID=1331689 RepID=A0A949T8N1_9PAST|nr:hypothetical protein [Ursidibacter maritimus]MBV6526658.1 hypothetical protein [Ursidibacter maritimus]MBV6530974.1 hypothetical protein [Ursidibacter maritimus]MBV6534663.1 hypothetical protein [Ursidibacter maritimus]MBV6537831.1 hypothetical protein [Ursidibacter maritimus]MBV6543540.1 hypothetical protein [Ursidibacter maritimus]